MKRTTPTSRRPHIDPDRLQSREAYRDDNYFDEVLLQLGIECTWDGKLAAAWEGIAIAASDLNHLWSVGRRPDCRSNFIMLSRPTHRYFHDHLKEGRVLALAAKLRKAERMKDPAEFSLAEIDEAAGKHVVGVVSGYQFEDPLFIRLRDEVLERLARLEREEEAA